MTPCHCHRLDFLHHGQDENQVLCAEQSNHIEAALVTNTKFSEPSPIANYSVEQHFVEERLSYLYVSSLLLTLVACSALRIGEFSTHVLLVNLHPITDAVIISQLNVGLEFSVSQAPLFCCQYTSDSPMTMSCCQFEGCLFLPVLQCPVSPNIESVKCF